MFDFLGKKMFLGLAVLAVIDFVWIFAAGHSIDAEGAELMLLCGLTALMLLALCTAQLRQIENAPSADAQPSYARYLPKLKKGSEILLFLSFGWIVLRLFNHLTMTTAFPYADEALALWDARIFGWWNAYFKFVAERPLIIDTMELAYSSLTPLSVVGSFYLFFIGREQAARFFITAFTITAVIATTWGMFFPAKAAVATVLNNTDLLTAFSKKPGWYSVDIIEHLRTASEIVFKLSYMPGLTTFPSFHTAAGIILAYSYRQSVLFLPVCAYTVVMIAATPVFGGHYFIDLVAGVALALVVCRLLETKETFQGVFDRLKKPRRQIGSAEPLTS